MTDQQLNFVERRRKIIHAWRWAGPAMICGILLFALYHFFRTPLLANPWRMIDKIKAGSIEPSTLELLALFVPVLFLILCFVLICLVGFIFLALRNERILIQIIAGEHQEKCSGESFTS